MHMYIMIRSYKYSVARTGRLASTPVSSRPTVIIDQTYVCCMLTSQTPRRGQKRKFYSAFIKDVNCVVKRHVVFSVLAESIIAG